MAVLPRPPAGNLWVFDRARLIPITDRQHPDAQCAHQVGNECILGFSEAMRDDELPPRAARHISIASIASIVSVTVPICFAVAMDSAQIKTGSLCRSKQIAKYIACSK